MNEILQADRINQVIRVIQLMQSDKDVTQEMACREVGIPVSTFRRWLSKEDQAIAAFQEEIRMVERNEVALIVSYQGHVMNKLMQEATAPTTFASDRLAIKQYMDKRMQELGDSMRTTTKLENDQFDGPARLPGSSTDRLIVNENEDGSVTIKKNKPQIIDGEIVDRP